MIPRAALVALVILQSVFAITSLRRAQEAETNAADALAQLEAQIRANRCMDYRPPAPWTAPRSTTAAFERGAR